MDNRCWTMLLGMGVTGVHCRSITTTSIYIVIIFITDGNVWCRSNEANSKITDDDSSHLQVHIQSVLGTMKNCLDRSQSADVDVAFLVLCPFLPCARVQHVGNWLYNVRAPPVHVSMVQEHNVIIGATSHFSECMSHVDSVLAVGNTPQDKH